MLSSSTLDAQSELKGPVGLFWDYDSIPSLEEQELVRLIHKLNELGGMLSGGKGFDTQVLCHHSPKNTEYFRKFGFEVVDQDGDSWPALDSGVLSVTAKILLWLWDLERKASDISKKDDRSSSIKETPPVILLVTANDHYAPLLTSLKQRGIDVVCLSTFSNCSNTSALRRACSSAIDFKQFISQDVTTVSAATLQGGDQTPQPISSQEGEQLNPPSRNDKPPGLVISSNNEEEGSQQEQEQRQKKEDQDKPPSPTSMQPTPRDKDDVPSTASHQAAPPLRLSHSLSSQSSHDGSILPDDRNLQEQQNLPAQVQRSQPLNQSSRLMAEEENNENDNDVDSTLLMEQRTLHDELVSAIYMNNVKAAVATLRKMYTRQSRSFRIPALLALIMPDTAGMLDDGQVELFHVSVKFSLDCIQWCFGIQRGENVESFKYKMNKNIARWMLKETQRKGLPNPASQYTINMSVALFKIILVDTTELEFALEILTCLNIPQPLQYFVPYVTTWMRAPPAFQQHIDLKVLQKFVYEHPDLHAYMQRGGGTGTSPLQSPRDQVNSSVSSIGSSSAPYLSSRTAPHTWEDNQGDGSKQQQNAYGSKVGSNKSQPEGREEWIRDSSSSTQQEARKQMLYHLNEYGENSGSQGGKHSRDVGDQRQGVTGQNPNTQPLEAKLLKLLMRSTKGELGARIPALYRDEYGEPLRLRGRKLKDILLETGLVEMVGSDGPGDKLFRIVGNPKGTESPRETSGGGGGGKAASRQQGMVMGGYPGSTRGYDNSSQHPRDCGDSYGSSMSLRSPRDNDHSDTSDRRGGGGGDQRRPFVPSLLNDSYPGGLSALVKNRDGGDNYGAHGYASMPPGSGSRQRQDDMHSPRQQRSDMSSGLMYGAYNSNSNGNSNSARRDEYSGDTSSRDGGGYSGRLYEDRSQGQGQASSYGFESCSTFDSLGGGGGGTLSELNMDSVMLNQSQQVQMQSGQRNFGGDSDNRGAQEEPAR